MAKKRLQIKYNFDFSLIGISSHVKDYRLCWILNNALNINLEQEENRYEAIHKKVSSTHVIFSFEDEENMSTYLLLKNHGNDGLFIPELKQFDYFLILKTDWQELVGSVVEELRNLPPVITVLNIDVKNLKSKQNLFF